MFGHGLQRVGTHHLIRLLRAIHRGTLPSPITRSALIASGFGDLEEHLTLLVGLDHQASQRLLVAVMAERRPREVRNAES